METQPQVNIVQEDEITLRELILKLQEYWRELWRNWWLIGLFCVPTVAYFLYKTFTHVPEYNAEVRFLVEGQGGSSFGGLGGLLGNFGIRTGGGGKANPYKILEVARSRRMIGNVIFDKSISNDEFIGNNIITEYEMEEKWAEKKPEMADFRFMDGEVETFDTTQRKAFLSVFRKVVGGKENRDAALLTIGLNEDNGIFSIQANTQDETLSLDLANYLYANLKDFFERQILEDQIKSRDILQMKVDSIDNEIDSKLRAVARFEDTSRGLVSRKAGISRDKMMVEVDGLSSAYVELQKSLTIADYELQNLKPLFLAIDTPYSPIKPSQESLLRNLILGLFLGGFLGAGFVIGRKIYQDAMQEE